MQRYVPSQIQGTTEYSGVVKFIVENSPAFDVGQFQIKEGDALGPETNDKDKTYFIIAGTLCVEETATGKKHTLNTGDIFVINGGEEHRSTSVGKDEAFVLWVRGK